MIDFKHVTKVYEPKITALKDVDVHIDKGEFVFVLGHSGAGKSTFLKLMLREEKATKGEVIVNGYNLSKIKENSTCGDNHNVHHAVEKTGKGLKCAHNLINFRFDVKEF